jgi:probable DNA metabolism protein
MEFFIVDGTENCFFTAVFDAYNKKDCIITSVGNVQLGFNSKVTEVASDEQKADRVRNKLKQVDSHSLNDIDLVLRSCDGTKEQVSFDYIKLIMQNHGPVRTMLALPTVMEMLDIRSRVTKEIDRQKGFLRFMENSEGVLYAPYSPDNDITDILSTHFAERFKNQHFVIHDIKRKIAAMYDGVNLVLFEAQNAEIYLSEYEKTFENLWKQYYKSVNISSRPHEKQMKGSMPVRYWKYLPEKNSSNQ